MSKRHVILSKTILFFSNAGKTEKVLEFEFEKFLKTNFVDDINVTFISSQPQSLGF